MAERALNPQLGLHGNNKNSGEAQYLYGVFALPGLYIKPWGFVAISGVAKFGIREMKDRRSRMLGSLREARAGVPKIMEGLIQAEPLLDNIPDRTAALGLENAAVRITGSCFRRNRLATAYRTETKYCNGAVHGSPCTAHCIVSTKKSC